MCISRAKLHPLQHTLPVVTSTLLLILSESPCLELRHHLRLDALPEPTRRTHLLQVILQVTTTTTNQTLTNELKQHLRLDALPGTRRQHVPFLKTANQTLTKNKLLHQLLVCRNALPEARRRHGLLAPGLTTANQTLTDQGRRIRRTTTTRDSMRRCQQLVVRRNSQTTQKMKTT